MDEAMESGQAGEIDLGVSHIEVSPRYDPGWATKKKALEREEKKTQDKSHSHVIIPVPNNHCFSFCSFFTFCYVRASLTSHWSNHMFTSPSSLLNFVKDKALSN